MLFDIRELDWSDELLADLDIPRALMPEVRGEFGGPLHHRGVDCSARIIPVAGVGGGPAGRAVWAGLFCARRGQEYLRDRIVPPDADGNRSHRVRKPPADDDCLGRSTARCNYALEGSIFVTGSAVQWLRDGLGIIRTHARSSRWRHRCRMRTASTSCRP